jgi:hypothetical protein
MSYTNHVILDETVSSDDEWVYKTTHPLVQYDSLVEVFLVDLKDGTCLEVYGKNRYDWAFLIADKVERGEIYID